jgi:hypothetical protein
MEESNGCVRFSPHAHFHSGLRRLWVAFGPDSCVGIPSQPTKRPKLGPCDPEGTRRPDSSGGRTTHREERRGTERREEEGRGTGAREADALDRPHGRERQSAQFPAQTQRLRVWTARIHPPTQFAPPPLHRLALRDAERSLVRRHLWPRTRAQGLSAATAIVVGRLGMGGGRRGDRGWCAARAILAARNGSQCKQQLCHVSQCISCSGTCGARQAAGMESFRAGVAA